MQSRCYPRDFRSIIQINGYDWIHFIYMIATVQVPEKVKGDFGSEKPRFDLGTKLYYRILESLLVSESQRLKEDNFTPMLTNDMFHRSLLACCLEIVTFSYKITLFPFPSIINSFQVSFYSLGELTFRFPLSILSKL